MRSIIFFISDGEEGINNVAVSDAWKQAFCNSPAYRGNPKGCYNYPIGFTAWAKNPTLDLKKVKLVLPGCSLFGKQLPKPSGNQPLWSYFLLLNGTRFQIPFSP